MAGMNRLTDTLLEVRDAMQSVIDDEECKRHGLYQGPYLPHYIAKLDALIELLKLGEAKTGEPISKDDWCPPAAGPYGMPFVVTSDVPSEVSFSFFTMDEWLATKGRIVDEPDPS